MAGTEFPILAVCPIEGDSLESFIRERFGTTRSLDYGSVMDRLTREAGWDPVDHTECCQGVSIWHNISQDGTDLCVRVPLPDGREGYVFSYDWDNHMDDEGILYLVHATDDEFVLTGFHMSGNGIEVTYAAGEDIDALYCNPELVQGTMRVATAPEKDAYVLRPDLPYRERKYILDTAGTIRKNYSKTGDIVFKKIVALPAEAFG